MSGKKAKALRKMQRVVGIEPSLDAKRRRAAEESARLEKMRTEAEAFRRDHPEEYAQQDREFKAKMQQTMNTILGAIGALSTR